MVFFFCNVFVPIAHEIIKVESHNNQINFITIRLNLHRHKKNQGFQAEFSIKIIYESNKQPKFLISNATLIGSISEDDINFVGYNPKELSSVEINRLYPESPYKTPNNYYRSDNENIIFGNHQRLENLLEKRKTNIEQIKNEEEGICFLSTGNNRAECEGILD